MSGPRCDRMLAGAALALLLAAPFDVSAQEAAKSPAIASPATEASPPPAIPAGEPPTASINTDPAAPAAPAAVTEETAAPDPLASLDPADRVVAEKIRDLLAATPDKIFASKNEKAAVQKFYQGRNLAPLWLDKGIENARAKAVIARLKEAEADGLDASDYRTPDFAALAPDALAEADLKLTQAVLTFARHLQAGRFPYARLSHNIHLPQTPPEPAAILARMVDARDAGKALDEFAPPRRPIRSSRRSLPRCARSRVAPE
jgi:L,D-transpeptidase YcbB